MPGLSLCGEFTISKLFFKYIEFFIAFPRILCIMFLFDLVNEKFRTTKQEGMLWILGKRSESCARPMT